MVYFSGLHFKVWSGCYCSSCDGLALLACTAINGYHGIATHSWETDGTVLTGEQTAWLISGVGMYKCTVTAGDGILCREFSVSGT